MVLVSLSMETVNGETGFYSSLSGLGLFLSLPGEHGSQKQHTHPPEKLPDWLLSPAVGVSPLGRPCLVPTPTPTPAPSGFVRALFRHSC